MRVFALVCAALLALLAATSTGARDRHESSGRLAGTTRIDRGCPAVTPGSSCNPWHPYPHARFRITRLTAGGRTIRGTTRTVESDAAARFRLALRAGYYLVRPMPGKDTKGGAPIRLRVGSRSTTPTVVRFAAKFRQA